MFRVFSQYFPLNMIHLFTKASK